MEKETVTMSDVEHVMELSRLDFTEAEKEKIKNNLNDIVNYFGVLSSVNTDGVQAINKPVGQPRVDVVKESMPSEEIVKNAPFHTTNAFIVPRVVE